MTNRLGLYLELSSQTRKLLHSKSVKKEFKRMSVQTSFCQYI